MNNLSFDEYINILSKVHKNIDIDNSLIVKVDPETKTEKIQTYSIDIDNNIFKISFFKSGLSQPQFNIFDELGKYVTSMISRSTSVHNIYNLFSKRVTEELKKNNISNNSYLIYAKGSLIFRNKIEKLLNEKLIKNKKIENLIKNVICTDKFNCKNPLLNESDFDVNCIIFNNVNRNKIKNVIAKVLIEIKNEIDNKKLYQKWLLSLNTNIHNSIIESLKYNDVKLFINENSEKSENSERNENSIDISKKTKKNIKKIFININKTKKNRPKNITTDLDESSELESRPLDDFLKNKKIKFVDYNRMMEIFKNLDQSRKSFYINNLKKHNYSFQCEIDNFNNIDDFFDNNKLKITQSFVSMHENIYNKLEKQNFKRIVHYDLYRLKLNFTFYMKYANSSEFKKNIGGEIIDVSFPYVDNAYFGKDPIDYENKLMKSQTYKGLNEYNVWGILNDLVETIEIESIDISKPHKFEKRINRFIMIRFLEYWFRIPFRINKDLSERSYYIFNNFIKTLGDNFDKFFIKTSYRDYEFTRIKNSLKINQNIEIFSVYRKLLRNEPYKTLFKLPRKTLDDAIGFKESEIASIKKITQTHKKLYSIFFDI